MKTKVWILLIFLFLGTSACTSEKAAEVGHAGVLQINRSLDPNIQHADAVNRVDGALVHWSDFDLKDERFKEGLPFKALNEEKDRNPNLTLRAIKQLPPVAAIRSITAFKLRLNEVRILAASEQTVFKNQVLCLMDAQSCLGSRPESNDQSRVSPNADFWKDAKVFPDALGRNTPFVEVASSDSSQKEFSPKDGVWEIDLLDAFGINGKEAIDFVIKSSAEYSDSKAGYRKFRLVLGDQIEAKGGEIILEYDLDLSAIPKEYSKRKPIPVHGGSDDVHYRGARRVKTPKAEDKSGDLNPLSEEQGGDASEGSGSQDLVASIEGSKLIPADGAPGITLEGRKTLGKIAQKIIQKGDGIRKVLVYQIGSAPEASNSKGLGAEVMQVLIESGVRSDQIEVSYQGRSGAGQKIGLDFEFSPELRMDQGAVTELSQQIQNDARDL